MLLKKWEQLPQEMQCEEIRPYYSVLSHKRISLIFKRIFDIVCSALMLIVLSPVFLILSIWIALDSKGGVFFKQERVTTYGESFYILKFRTMVKDAERLGSLVTVSNDCRITAAGRFLRKSRLDELPQLINVLKGEMSFVGTRPEVKKYVDAYSKEMLATLLLPAGITSQASIRYKDEDILLKAAENVDETYSRTVLPAKMYYNLREVRNFSFWCDIRTMFSTVLAVCGWLKTEELEYTEENDTTKV